MEKTRKSSYASLCLFVSFFCTLCLLPWTTVTEFSMECSVDFWIKLKNTSTSSHTIPNFKKKRRTIQKLLLIYNIVMIHCGRLAYVNGNIVILR